MKKAIIDVGTNTAHILIAEVIDNKIDRICYKKRFYTFLGEGGLDHISQNAIDRLMEALESFEISITEYGCQQVSVLATEALRSAANGPLIHQNLTSRFGWPIHIISGQKEAQYIYQGANQSTDLSDGSSLVMDIGGGSVEFIYVRDGVVSFQESYPIGISRLYEQYHISEPISNMEVDRIISHLEDTLSEMWTQVNLGHPIKLVGCAGTFEVFLDQKDVDNLDISATIVDTQSVQSLWHEIKTKDISERSLVKGLPPARVKYIVVAVLLIKYVIDRLSLSDFVVSKYALKEGSIIDGDLFLD